MAVPEQVMTRAEFEAQYAGQPFELVEGRVREVSPSGIEASETALIIGAELRLHLKSNPVGRVTGADGGYWLDDQTMVAPDVAFVTNERLAGMTEPERFAPFAPDLAVEVVSPSDGAAEVQRKVRRYLAAGVRLVVVVYPALRELVVHAPNGTARTLTESDTLTFDDLLPGFSARVGDLFPAAPAP